MPIRVKFCGITRTDDAQLAASLGASAIGLVFVEGSPRAVDVEQARAICRELPPLVSTVGLFMNAEPEAVRAVCSRVALNFLQFHGDESPEYCEAFERPFFKALPMASPDKVQYDDWAGAAALLLDAHPAGGMGGSGRTFDWASARRPKQPWMLAGGLNPDNIATAVRTLAPPAVDVSSGIERAPGVKDATLMRRFMERIGHD